MERNSRNGVLAKAVAVLGIAEMASHLHISETLVHAYACGDQPIPDATWVLTVKYLVDRVSAPPVPQPSNLL
jgi:hypothetical protein